MRILLISNLFWPDQTARAFRWGALAQQLAARGHRISIISGWRSGLERNEHWSGVEITRVPGTLKAGLQLMRRRGGRDVRPVEVGESEPNRGSFGRLQSAYQACWNAVCWPDATALWLLPAARTASKIAREIRPDAMISVSLPFTAHCVASILKSRDPELPWLVDIGDPFSGSEGDGANHKEMYEWLNLRADRQMLRRCDAICVTNSGAKEYYQQLADVAADRISVIPPLLSVSVAAVHSASVSGAAVKLVFAGTLYARLRRPESLLRIYRLASERARVPLELHFVGSIENCREAFDEYRDLIQAGRLVLHGTLPRAKAAALMASANALVNIGNATALQIPSKVVEYLSCGKPIVNISSTDRDSSRAFLTSYPRTLQIDIHRDGTEESAARLTSFLEFPQRPLSEREISAIRRPYEPEAIADAYERQLLQIARQGAVASPGVAV